MSASWDKVKKGTVTSPLGFYASGLHCGIKKSKAKYDVSLVYSPLACTAAGVFTVNRVKAWPVQSSMKTIKEAKHRAILATSGNANCVNGDQGKRSVEEAVGELAKCMSLDEEEILIAQTGLIGVPFPITRLKRALPKLVKRLSDKGGHNAARGIMTTDLKAKEVALSFSLHGRKVTIGAMAKGAGMVHPNMATMLCFVTTDVAITKPLLRRALRHAADDTFNQMAIDNDQSTNDLVFALANGLARNPTIQKVDRDYRQFREVLEEVCRQMAYAMVRDGEGVSHVCTLKISGAKNPTEAERAARHIANSMLFKTMLAGSDPNWGRIVAAMGASGIHFKPAQVNLSFGGVQVVSHGRLRALNLPKARRVLQKPEYTLEISIGKGRGRAEFVTSDLTTKYVQINSHYN